MCPLKCIEFLDILFLVWPHCSLIFRIPQVTSVLVIEKQLYSSYGKGHRCSEREKQEKRILKNALFKKKIKNVKEWAKERVI